MAQDIVGNLFGIAPQDISRQQMNAEMNAAVNFANLNPRQQANYGGFLAGQMLGRGASGLLGAEDPRLQQARVVQEAQQQGFDVTTPEGLQQLAQFFVQRGQPGLASQVATQAQSMSRSAAEEQYKLAQAQAALREKQGSPKTQAQQVRLNQLKAQYGEIEGSRLFDEELYLQEKGLALANAGVPESGNVKPSDLSTLQGVVDKYVKAPYEKLQALQEVKGSFKLAADGNTAAVPQLMRALVRIGGNDPQIAAREVAGIAGNPGAVGRIAEAVNAFWTGTPSAEQIKLIGQVLASSESIVGQQYTQGRQQAETVLGEAKINPQTQKALLPPIWNAPKPKQPQATPTTKWDADKEARYQAWKKQQGL